MADFLKREEVKDAYQRNAKYYDLGVLLYPLIGIRIDRWRQLVLDELSPKPGDTIVEIGCGTGLNFAGLQRAIGEEGKIIGIDISEAMLEIARKRIAENGWDNIELICCSASDFVFPEKVDGILSTGALTFDPDYDAVIKRGAKALSKGRRWVILDYKMPANWLRYLAPYLVALWRPFGVSVKLMERKAWLSIEAHLVNTRMQELYGGFVYISSGEANRLLSSDREENLRIK